MRVGMRIAEIFYSIQGEGELTGVPSVFIRTSGCNLRCRWCDTPYASWNPQGEEKSIAAILALVERFPARHCVLTGGEPMVAKGIRELALELRSRGWHITIETAGTVEPEGIACDLVSLSPKLPNSTPEPEAFGERWMHQHDMRRIQPGILTQWVRHCAYQFKFVVADPQDVADMDAVLATLGEKVPAWKVLVMPEGTQSARIRERSDALVALCKERGFRFCDRLHIHLFGNTMGT